MIFGINALSPTPGHGGGSESYLRELVAHLALVDAENEYRLFVSAATRNLLSASAPNFRTIAVPLGQSASCRWAKEQLWLPAAARRVGVDALYYPSAVIPRLWSLPAVITIHRELSLRPEHWARGDHFFSRWRSVLRERKQRTALLQTARRAAAILAASDPIRRELMRFGAIDPARIAVARPGVSSRFQPVEAPARLAGLLERHGLRAPFILVAGALSPYRSLDRVIEGLAQVRRWSHRLPMLALMGDDRFGIRPSLERLAIGLDLQEHIRFLEGVAAIDLPALYTAATASLSPSPGEASGLPLIEAMACGCPVICARRTAAPQVPGEAALFVDPDRPQEIAEAIWRLATLPNIRDAWVARGLEHARQFDWRETARVTRDALLAAAQGRRVREKPAVSSSGLRAEPASGCATLPTEASGDSGPGPEPRGK